MTDRNDMQAARPKDADTRRLDAPAGRAATLIDERNLANPEVRLRLAYSALPAANAQQRTPADIQGATKRLAAMISPDAVPAAEAPRIMTKEDSENIHQIMQRLAAAQIAKTEDEVRALVAQYEFSSPDIASRFAERMVGLVKNGVFPLPTTTVHMNMIDTDAKEPYKK